MKAIVTRYHGATNTRGSRISASAKGGKRPHRVSIPYPHELNHDDAHGAAALALCRKMKWTGVLVCGGMPDGRGRVFVFYKENDIHTRRFIAP